MATRDFAELQRTSLLADVEAVVVDAHRRLHEERGEAWSRPRAYRWLRYEDPDPIARLGEGVVRLDAWGAPIDAEAVDKACVKAAKLGYPN